MTWTPEDLRKILNKAARRKLNVVDFDVEAETLTIATRTKAPVEPTAEDQIRAAYKRSKIEAIKLARQHFQLGLAEAKNYVEEMCER